MPLTQTHKIVLGATITVLVIGIVSLIIYVIVSNSSSDSSNASNLYDPIEDDADELNDDTPSQLTLVTFDCLSDTCSLGTTPYINTVFTVQPDQSVQNYSNTNANISGDTTTTVSITFTTSTIWTNEVSSTFIATGTLKTSTETVTTTSSSSTETDGFNTTSDKSSSSKTTNSSSSNLSILIGEYTPYGSSLITLNPIVQTAISDETSIRGTWECSSISDSTQSYELILE